MLADRYGGKGVLAAGVGAWSLCTVLTPPAASLGIPVLLGMRQANGSPACHALPCGVCCSVLGAKRLPASACRVPCPDSQLS